jgi:glycosyltransferase involved in cell wall biosynthesis
MAVSAPEVGSLAIVVPAYKGSFLKQALESISAQTNKDFAVYVGDDNSPEDLETIVKEFEKDLPIQYRRFEQNIGKQSLIKSWERCVALSKNETWIWLFADDDEMGSDCVDAFYKTNPRIENVYRFNMTMKLDKEKLLEPTDYPSSEQPREFLASRLAYRYDSAMSNVIFSRDSYDKAGGFVEFPLAWGSDDASILEFASFGRIMTIPAGIVSWRQSDQNISANMTSDILLTKFHAREQYLKWILTRKNTFFTGEKETFTTLQPWIFHGYEVELRQAPWTKKMAVLVGLGNIIGFRFYFFLAQTYGKRYFSFVKGVFKKAFVSNHAG